MASIISSGFTKKQFFKFTGPPENWLTAINFMTWGLEEKYRDRWNRILPGDIFLMHSTSTSSVLRKAPSSLIGFGVVGSNLKTKASPLWIQELETNTNTWPLLVPFSEIYLFSAFFQTNNPIAPSSNNAEAVERICREFLKDAVPLSSLPGFPAMGSIASVSQQVVTTLFSMARNLYVIGSQEQSEINEEYSASPLLPIEAATDSFRYGTSLQFLDEVKRKTHTTKSSSYTKDQTLLERADRAHEETLTRLLELFKSKNYDTYFNKHVDLYATNGDLSYLVEVKSNENKNFMPQARKGIVQLFEYEYFEINKFVSTASKKPKRLFKNIAFSSEPGNEDYVRFVNHLDLGVSHFQGEDWQPVGKSLGLELL